MANTADPLFLNYGHDVALGHHLGFVAERSDKPWSRHESEPVRFVWDDEDALAFSLYRFADGALVCKLSASGIEDLDVFRAVVRGFLHG